MENESTVNVNEKKEFIRWFLQRYKIKTRQSVWILNYLMSHEEILSKVRFVEDVSKYERGVLISASNGNNNLPPFKFYKGSVETTDGEKAFHDLRLHPNEPMCIQLNFNGKDKCHEYMVVAEAYNNNEVLSPAGLEEAENIMAVLQRQMILKEIDKALDKGGSEVVYGIMGAVE